MAEEEPPPGSIGSLPGVPVAAAPGIPIPPQTITQPLKTLEMPAPAPSSKPPPPKMEG
jgi:hypothetical protein